LKGSFQESKAAGSRR